MENLSERLRTAGVVETHYHVGPELLPRRYDVTALAEAAQAWNATIVLKNHTYPTTPLAALARRRHGARFLGSVTLNRFVGGLNPDAVDGALSGNRTSVDDPSSQDPPVFVWMPTVHAAAHLRVLGHSFDPRWSGCCAGHHGGPGGADPEAAPRPEQPVVAFDGDLQPRPELIQVLEAIARTRSVLATGHLSAAEVMRLVPLARELGVRAVVITHPHYPSTRLDDGALRDLTRDPHVFVEHCFAVHTIEQVPLEEMARAIVATGCDQVVLSTDFGQVHSDPFPDGTLRFAREMTARLAGRLGEDAIVQMMTDNGRRLLSLAGGR